MADYFAHWLKAGEREGAELPRIFYVNWFRKDADGKFLWPGFGENSRVLEWVFRRCEDEADAVETPLGLLPTEGAINTEGLNVSPQAMEELLSVDVEQVKAQLPQIQEHLAKFGEKLPAEISAQLGALEARLG
jgi:phosphoenolpyruvate carboxykinase (GTP)